MRQIQNVVSRREGDKLILEIDLTQNQGPSQSGKTDIVASTRGNAPVPEAEGVYYSVNCFKYATPKKG